MNASGDDSISIPVVIIEFEYDLSHNVECTFMLDIF